MVVLRGIHRNYRGYRCGVCEGLDLVSGFGFFSVLQNP
jgi:hypothetical protein